MSALPRVTAIVGPTASGKSSLAERVALELKSPVISVDAMQIYRGMDIGTAKTPPTERRVPLLMVDVAEIGDDYSVALFQRDARRCVDQVLAEGHHPVLCGGTGLYLDAVVDEMDFPAGTKASPARDRYETYARERGAEALHELLAERDARAAALIHPHNLRRVVRALEMCDEGVSYADQNEGLHARLPHYDVAMWGITMERERLYARIDQRVDEMFAVGLVDEVERLREAGLAQAPTASQAIGYKEILAALEGACTLDEARAEVKRRSRHYAKRQLSWLKRDGRVKWLDYDQLGEDEACALVLAACNEEA